MNVRRDQCNGRTMSCVCCDSPLDEPHHILCYAGQKQFDEPVADLPVGEPKPALNPKGET